MNQDLMKFKENSIKKFELLESENSELFKKQTFFKEFENNIESNGISSDFGVNIVEEQEGIIIKPINEMNFKDIFSRFNIDDKFVQMNNAFFNSGIFVEIPKGKVFDQPLRINSLPNKNLISKIIIIANDESGLNLVKESYSKDDNPLLISEDVLVVVGNNSQITFSELQNYNKSSTYMSNKIAVCGKESKVVWNLGIFGGGKSRSRTYNFLEGDGSFIEDLQLTFGDGEQQFDAFSNLVHIGKSTSAKSLAKGAFKDKSNSIFKGMIKIKNKAKNASSYLACHGMLLSKSAKANAIPSLEIETNDVKATHAASVSPIDEEKIFYLKARGISDDTARKMITLGFLDPLIRSIESREIRAKMRWLIEAKWHGERTDAFDDKKLKEFVEEDAIKRGDIFEGHYKYR